MKLRKFRAALVVGLLPFFCGSAAAEEWTWSITPYLWLTDIGLDVSIRERQVVNETIDVSDLVEDLEFILQVHAEGQYKENGLMFDVFYAKMSDDPQTAPLPTPPGGTAVVDAEIDLTILEVGGIYDAKGDHEGFQVLYGARILSQGADIDAQFTPGVGPPAARSYDPSDRFYDGLLGARWVKRFGKGWSTSLRADLSVGGTKLTWNANTIFGYSFGKNLGYTVMGGYRYMDIDFKEQDNVDSEMTLSGPVIGFRFSF